jgi:hypothetical protein
MYRDTMNVEHEMMIVSMIMPVKTGATRIVKQGSKKNVEAIPGNIQRFTIKDSCTWNISQNMERTAL